MSCYVGTDPGKISPVSQVRRATLVPFLYPLLFYQKSGQKSIILCVSNMTNGRKNRRNTAPEIVQYDELHSACPGTLGQQERSPAEHQRQHRHAVAESRAAAERRRPYNSAGKAAGAAEHEKRSAASKASSRDRTESGEAPARRSSPAPEQRGRIRPAAGSRRRSRQHPEAIPGSARG